MSEDINQRISSIMQVVFEDKSIVCSNELTAHDVEKWNSVSNITFIAAVEKEFNFKFNIMEIMSLKNVGDLIRAIQKKIV
jgi:acyl carrier protein